jgi:class 3 adenylate cyclase/tetratricopeptide (TPR) repeat protein
MKCPLCQHENPTGMKFCGECAAPLASTCSSCGAVNPPESKFCGQCATLLRTAAAKFSAPDAYTPKRLAEKILTSKTALEGERKQVTVLFADLKGSMEMLADRDPEEARKLLDPVLEHMMEAVHRYEGTVNQVMGDGIMALFGAPLAHEDHAVRACYAALRMQDTVKRYALEVRRSEGVLPQIRVGLNSGEVVVRSIGSDLRMDYSAVGQTTHLAARMEQIAVVDSILLTAGTLRLAEGYVQVKPLGPINVKGLGEPLEVFELTGAGLARTRLQAAASRGLTRFVGRGAEIEAVRQALERAHSGHGEIVAMVGEPGVGKSRLVWEFTHSHRTQDWLILESGSVSYGKATAYLPVIDLLKAYFQIEGRDDTRKIREKVTGKVLSLDRQLEPMLPPLLSLLDVAVEDAEWDRLDPLRRRQRTLDGVKRLLLRESQVQPLLVLFEDLHWVDAETQAFLDSLVESLPTAQMLVLVNYRPEYQHGWGSKTYYRQLRIDPLPVESAEDLLASLLGDDAGLQALKRLLIDRTEGNPLFLEESIRTLFETGAIAGERGAYRLTRPVSSLQVPASVHAVLAARIDRLDADDKQLLQAAAVVGKDVPLALLQGVSGLDENGVTLELARLQKAEFLYETGLFPEPEYTFKHALTHEVAYGSLLADRRRALHARVVETIEARFADRLSQHSEQLAHHAFRGELWDRALLYMRQVGQKAASRSAHREAEASFEQALTALGHLAKSRETCEQAIDLRLELRASLFTIGELSRLPDVLGEAEAIATAIGDRPRQAMVLVFLSNHYFEMAESARAGDYAERALAIARDVGSAGLEAAATMQLGRSLFNLGDYRRAIDLLGRAAPVLREHATEPFGAPSTGAVACLTFLARAHMEVGQFGQAVETAKEAIQLSEEGDVAFGLVHGHFAIGVAHLRKGDLEAAVSILERGLGIARTRSVSFLEPLLSSALGLAFAYLGRIAEGITLLELGSRGAAKMGHRSMTIILQGWLAEGYFLAERWADAADSALGSLEAARHVGLPRPLTHALTVLAHIAASAQPPRVAEAENHYLAALTMADERGMRPVAAQCHLGLGLLYRRVGNRQRAQEHLAAATMMFREMDMRFWLEQSQAEMRDE